MKMLIKFITVLPLALGISMTARADLISVADVMATSTYKSFVAENLINGKGLKGVNHTGGNKGKWIGAKNDLPSLVFDLGEVFDVSSTTIWNFGKDNNRNVKDILVSSSIDGVVYNTIGNLGLSKTQGKRFAGEAFSLDTLARFIRIDIQDNYGARFSGLSEVQFNGEVADAPEPASILLMLAGLAGLVYRGRNKQV